MYLCPKGSPETECNGKAIVNTERSNSRALVLERIPDKYMGILKAQVLVGDKISESQELTFSRIGRWLSLILSVAVSAFLIGLILLLFHKFKQHRERPNGEKMGFLEGLLID